MSCVSIHHWAVRVHRSQLAFVPGTLVEANVYKKYILEVLHCHPSCFVLPLWFLSLLSVLLKGRTHKTITQKGRMVFSFSVFDSLLISVHIK